VLPEALDDWPSTFLHPEHLGDGGGHQRGIGQGRQLHPKGAMVEDID
jgi:hypothetical protein